MKASLLKEVREHFSSDFAHGRYTYKRKVNVPDIKLTPKKRVLEVGCGARFTVSSPSQKYGIDITPELLKELKQLKPHINVVISDARYLPFRTQTFHLVVAISLFHHLVGRTPTASKSNIMTSLREATRVLEEKGYVFIFERLAVNRVLTLLMFYATLICAKLGLNLKWFDIHEKVVTYYLDNDSLKEMIDRATLRICSSSSWVWSFKGFNLGGFNTIMLQK